MDLPSRIPHKAVYSNGLVLFGFFHPLVLCSKKDKQEAANHKPMYKVARGTLQYVEQSNRKTELKYYRLDSVSTLESYYGHI